MKDLVKNGFILTGLFFILLNVYDIAIANPYVKAELNQIHSALEETSVRFKKVVAAQIVHETGWLQSKVYNIHNNAFGMMCNTKGICICKDTNISCVDGTYCHYDNVTQSIKDYAIWQEARIVEYERHSGKKVTNEMEYITMLDGYYIRGVGGKKYATDKIYTRKLIGVMNKIEQNSRIFILNEKIRRWLNIKKETLDLAGS